MFSLLAILAVVMLVGGTDMTKTALALPHIGESLTLGPITSLWVADAYALASGAALIPSAVLADRFGRKRIYLLGLLVAILGAAAAGLAPSAELLVLGRITQGFGAALLIAGTVALIRVNFPGTVLRGIAYGVWAASFSIGSALGPLVGGALVEVAEWSWIFWINVPLFGACLIVATLVVRESRNPDPPSLDPLSAFTSALAVTAVIFAIKSAAQPQTPWWPAALAAIVGLAAIIWFVRRQLRMSRPYLDVRLFTIPLLAACSVVAVVVVGAFNGTLYLLTQRLQIVDGRSVIDAGIALLPLAVACAVGSLTGPALQKRLPQQHIVVTGLTLATTGAVLLVTTGLPLPLPLALLGGGAGMIMAIGANAIMSSAPENRTADAGAIQETSFTIGAGTGIATLGALTIFFGSRGLDAPAAADIYERGADIALGVGAGFLVLFTIVASTIILRTLPTEESVPSQR